ncbi:exonuclease domain-containing protein [Nocardiopsis ansamitocini]|uniref:3'-5' exonuclease n=1 Tax=Nocardiopsis ansamitocini TaxID=1670832 RepID=A0A9W6P3B4_9ACTN|nr:exonuclease domain-containing protein [Nocardiopsis ansamitocini]GLU46312.1 3'-5' exonuclease [Nocardiopsis ansamitocini]
MTNWHLNRLVALDTETTGVDTDSDRIVTAALLRVNGTTGGVEELSWLIDPGIDIPEEATQIHGITTEHARAHGRPAAEAVGEIVAALASVAAADTPVVAYNAAFDLTLLDREARRHGHQVDLTGLRVIDPMVLDKQADPYRRGGRKLVDVCAHHGVVFTGAAHGATADALAAARLAWKLAHTTPHLAAMDLEDLHTAQKHWRAHQAASLEEYLRRTDPEAVVERDWPFIPA